MKASEIKQTLDEMQSLANDLSEAEARYRMHNDIVAHRESLSSATGADYEYRNELSVKKESIKSQIKQLAKSIYEQD